MRGIPDCEMDVMNVIWDFGEEATEQTKIKAELERRKGRVYGRPTVSTWLLRLKKRRLVEGFLQKGISYYRPLVTREEYARLEIRMLEKKLFADSPFAMTSAFAAREKMTEEEKKKIEEMLNDWDN